MSRVARKVAYGVLSGIGIFYFCGLTLPLVDAEPDGGMRNVEERQNLEHLKEVKHDRPEGMGEQQGNPGQPHEVMAHKKEKLLWMKEHNPERYEQFLKNHPRLAAKIAGHEDRAEDYGEGAAEISGETSPPPPGPAADRREDIRDHREEMHDRREDIRDHREDVRDHREDHWDKMEDRHDHRENVRDHHEDRKDKMEDRHDHAHHDHGVRDYGKGEGRGKGQGGEHRAGGPGPRAHKNG